MELQRLRHLLAVATHGTYRRAADAVHLTQPALSRSIRLLEAEVGMSLVARTARGSTLTEAGRVLADRARRLLEEADDTRRALARLRGDPAAPLRVGTSATVHALVARSFVARVAGEHPDLRAEIVLGDTHTLHESLRAGALDAVAGDGETFAGDPTLDVEPLDSGPVWLVGRRGHPLADAGEITLHRLRPYAVAAAPLSNATARRIRTALGAELEQMIRFTIFDPGITEEAVRSTDLLYVGNALGVARAVAAGELVVLPFAPLRAFHARIALARPAGRAPCPALALFRRCLRAAIAEGRTHLDAAAAAGAR